MRLMSRLLVSIALLCIAISTGGATTRDRAGLDWQTFQVPQYGTHVEYPARLFAPVGEAEKGVGQRFESEDGRASGVVSMMSNIFSPNARTSFLAYTGSTPRIMPDERYFSMPSAEVGGDARRKMDRHAARP